MAGMGGGGHGRIGPPGSASALFDSIKMLSFPLKVTTSQEANAYKLHDDDDDETCDCWSARSKVEGGDVKEDERRLATWTDVESVV